MKVQPLSDRILVRRIEEREITKGGIVIPDTAKEKSLEAEVIAVGPGKAKKNGERASIEVKKGDRILAGKFEGTDVEINGEEYVVMRQSDVLAIIEI